METVAGATLSWAEQLDDFARAARRSSRLSAARDRFLRGARRALALPLVRRVYRYEDIGRHRTWLDGRAVPLKEPMHTIFALAMSDHGTNNLLATELPMLAAAARLSGDERLLARVHEQLHEMAAWSPLQRPGWCAYGDRLPPDGKDGNWLATGTGVRAIADTLEILGHAALPPATVARLDQLLAAEIVSICDDWEARRPWFVYAPFPLTNQWVFPTEGLVRACLVLDRSRHKAAYELGVANIAEHLNAHGAQGAFEEGIHYADATVTSLLSAARAMAVAGDRRVAEHRFLQRFPIWAIHHFQPGGFFINAFDAFSATRGNPDVLRNTLALAAVCLGSRESLWALNQLAGGADDSLVGLVARTLPRTRARQPPLYAAYQRATRVNWRNSWQSEATGVWVRGGDEHDSHDHANRGHVNVILHGRPVLIEAGTPAYHNPRLRADYASGRGHNVLQLGTQATAKGLGDSVVPPGWQRWQAVAPLTVRRLDGRGGDVTVDGTAGYEGLERWLRRVTWRAYELAAEDSVTLTPGNPQVVLFRWHLGIRRAPRIVTERCGACVSWPGVRLRVEGDAPLRFEIEPMPDHTLRYRKWDDPRESLHACLVVRTAKKVAQCTVRLSVSAAD